MARRDGQRPSRRHPWCPVSLGLVLLRTTPPLLRPLFLHRGLYHLHLAASGRRHTIGHSCSRAEAEWPLAPAGAASLAPSGEAAYGSPSQPRALGLTWTLFRVEAKGTALEARSYHASQ